MYPLKAPEVSGPKLYQNYHTKSGLARQKIFNFFLQEILKKLSPIRPSFSQHLNVSQGFEVGTLSECLDYIKQEIIKKEEYADRIEIVMD